MYYISVWINNLLSVKYSAAWTEWLYIYSGWKLQYIFVHKVEHYHYVLLQNIMLFCHTTKNSPILQGPILSQKHFQTRCMNKNHIFITILKCHGYLKERLAFFQTKSNQADVFCILYSKPSLHNFSGSTRPMSSQCPCPSSWSQS